MRKSSKIFPLLLLLLMLGGCVPSWSTEGKIMAPVYEQCPLEGKWLVSADAGATDISAGESEKKEDDFFQFSRAIAIIGSNIWGNPTYKIKKVNARNYLTSRYTVLDDFLIAVNQNVEVVTVFAESNYLGEFMKTGDDAAVAFVQNKVLLLHKVACRADDPRMVGNLSSGDINHYSKTGAAGVFVGLKIPSEQEYIYKTFWIATDNKELRPVLYRDDIYFPRKSGFWGLQVKKREQGKELFAHNMAEKEPVGDKNKVSDLTATSFAESIEIDFISNDYVAVEKSIDGQGRLQVLPVDNLASPIGIKVVDLLGSAGLKAYHNGREQAIKSLSSRKDNFCNADENEDNFGVIRQNGHWKLRGRAGYSDNSEPAAWEFNINVLPPANLVYYDTLYPGWQSIKDRVPHVLDALTSPNKDFAVVKTKSKLYIFGINGEQLNSSPLKEISLPEGATIIMAEWATGFYVDDWEKSFSANGAEVF